MRYEVSPQRSQSGKFREEEPCPVRTGASAFAPLQFAVQDFEVGFFYGLNELESFVRTGDVDAIGLIHGDTGLSVER